MDIKQLNEELSKFLKEDTSIDDMLSDFVCYNIEENGNITYYDFGFICFDNLSTKAFKKVLPHVEELQIEEKPFNGVVFITSGYNLSSIKYGYIKASIELQNGITLNKEILDKFNNFRNKIYRKYVKFAGYKNTDGDMNDIAPVNVDFLIEKDDITDSEYVLAVFPEIKDNPNECLCYSHLGQHGFTSPDYYKSLNKATKEQYMPLYNELTNQIGYNLNVMNKDF